MDPRNTGFRSVNVSQADRDLESSTTSPGQRSSSPRRLPRMQNPASASASRLRISRTYPSNGRRPSNSGVSLSSSSPASVTRIDERESVARPLTSSPSPVSATRPTLPSSPSRLEAPASPRIRIERQSRGTEAAISLPPDPSTRADQDSDALEAYQRTCRRIAQSKQASSRSANTMRPPEALNPTLRDHIYTRGFLGGRHSDVTVLAFGKEYKLHRIILDRATFFATAFSGPWAESTSREITLYPEQVDPNITQRAFEQALAHLYGGPVALDDEGGTAAGVFAVGCWLEMPEVVDAAVASILRRLSRPKRLAHVVRLVTDSCYGGPGARLLGAAKAVLCRVGWGMPVRCWDDMPAAVVREVVGDDGFFVAGEWERWLLARRLLDRRLKQTALSAGLLEPGSEPPKAPSGLQSSLPRFNQGALSFEKPILEGQCDEWISMYSDDEVHPLLQLMDEGIHYMHLEFEQLQFIKEAKDLFGLPVVPESVVMNALYMQLELKQKVLHARETDQELGLLIPPDAGDDRVEPEGTGKGKEPAKHSQNPDESINAEKGARFQIPSEDTNTVYGAGSRPLATRRLAPRQTNSMHVYFPVPPVPIPGETESPPPPTSLDGRAPKPPLGHSKFPPLRFAAEFPPLRQLHDWHRVLSHAAFYAGSHWSLCVQKVRAADGAVQLGMFLHRAREPLDDDDDGDDDEDDWARPPRPGDRRVSAAPTASSAGGRRGRQRGPPMRSAMRRLAPPGRRRPSSAPQAVSVEPDDEGGSDGSAAGLDGRAGRGSPFGAPLPPPRGVRALLPPYSDPREATTAYFKIFAAGPAGRLLSAFEAAPGRFGYREEWGWRSSALALGDGGADEVEDWANEPLRFSVVVGSV